MYYFSELMVTIKQEPILRRGMGKPTFGSFYDTVRELEGGMAIKSSGSIQE